MSGNVGARFPSGMRVKNAVRMACAAAALVAGVSPLARAANSEMHAVEEVIVTAQKRSESLMQVPVPVTAVSAEPLVQANQLQLQDYYNQIPGLALAYLGDTDSPTIAIRGITAGGFTNPTVGVVIDDVPYGGTIVTSIAPSPPDVDPGDLARIEVLRGPQGTLYGASSMGGLLKFVTVDPSTDEFAARVQAGFSSVEDGGDGYIFRGSMNAPMGDALAVRVSGFKGRDPGYVDNELTGQSDVNERESEGVRLAALWRPSESFSLKLNGLYQDSTRLGGNDVNVALGGLNQNAVRDSGQYARTLHAYDAIINASVGSVELTSATGYSIDKMLTLGDLTTIAGGFWGAMADVFFSATGVSSPVDRRFEKFSQELRASIPLGENVEWLVGAFYTDEDAEGGGTVDAVDPQTAEPAGVLFYSQSPTTFEEYAAFTNLTVDVTDKFDVQFGGRYSENRQTLSSVRGGPIAALFFLADPSALPERRSEDGAFTYLVTPRYRFSQDLMAYVRIASGYRPGGANLGCGFTPCSYDPDTTQNYEIGVKGNVLDDALSFDASVYYIDWKDIQTTLVLNGFGFQANAARARSQGVELSFDARPLAGFTVAGWLAWNDAELTEGFPVNSTFVGRDGDRLPNSSRFSGSLSLEQAFPIGAALTARIGASVSYMGERVGTFQATPTREVFPEYTEVDLHVGATYEDWTVSAYLNNVTDERGVLRGGLDGIGPTFFSYIQPRTIGMSLTKSF
jgi:iron complex outermembrane receptor protein